MLVAYIVFPNYLWSYQSHITCIKAWVLIWVFKATLLLTLIVSILALCHVPSPNAIIKSIVQQGWFTVSLKANSSMSQYKFRSVCWRSIHSSVSVYKTLQELPSSTRNLVRFRSTMVTTKIKGISKFKIPSIFSRSRNHNSDWSLIRWTSLFMVSERHYDDKHIWDVVELWILSINDN